VRFGLGGAEYEIDLSKKNAAGVPPQARPPSSTMPARPGRQGAPPADAYRGQPGAQRDHPGMGERPGHRGQRPRPHPR
jgi:hypothetical protein